MVVTEVNVLDRVTIGLPPLLRNECEVLSRTRKVCSLNSGLVHLLLGLLRDWRKKKEEKEKEKEKEDELTEERKKKEKKEKKRRKKWVPLLSTLSRMAFNVASKNPSKKMSRTVERRES